MTQDSDNGDLEKQIIVIAKSEIGAIHQSQLPGPSGKPPTITPEEKKTQFLPKNKLLKTGAVHQSQPPAALGNLPAVTSVERITEFLPTNKALNIGAVRESQSSATLGKPLTLTPEENIVPLVQRIN